jgi:hypothetical protein
LGSGCWLSGGRWFSYYDRVSQTFPSDIDIDHVVPLAEVWDSGARSWTDVVRRATSPTTSATTEPWSG